MSKVLSTALCASLLSLLPVGQAKSDIIAHWTANETFADSVGGHDGSPFGFVTFEDGVFGKAFFFNGSGGHVRVPDSNEFDFGTSDFSVSFRVLYVRLVVNGSGLIDKDNYMEPSSNEYNGWLFNNDNIVGDGVGIVIRDTPVVGPYHIRHASSNFKLMEWYNITSTRSSGINRLYVDGILVKEVKSPVIVDVTNSIDLIIGGLSPLPSANQPHHGRIDDIAIYNHALSASEVKSIFLHGVAGSDFLLGDVNCDSVVNLLDVAPFVETVSSGQYDPKADCNQDGTVNLLDVDPFVGILGGG